MKKKLGIGLLVGLVMVLFVGFSLGQDEETKDVQGDKKIDSITVDGTKEDESTYKRDNKKVVKEDSKLIEKKVAKKNRENKQVGQKKNDKVSKPSKVASKKKASDKVTTKRVTVEKEVTPRSNRQVASKKSNSKVNKVNKVKEVEEVNSNNEVLDSQVDSEREKPVEQEVKPEPVEPTETEVVVEIKKELESNVLSYETVKQDDPTLDKGQTKVKQVGKNGKEVITYEVRYENGKEVSRKEVGRQVTVKPVNEIILVGTKEEVKPEPVEPIEPEVVVEIKKELESNVLSYETVKQDDPTLDKGQTKVKQVGKNGKEVVTYEVRYEDGKEVSRKEVGRQVTVKPVNKIILVGTKEEVKPEPVEPTEPEVVVEIKKELENNVLSYETVKQDDPTLEKGQTKVKQAGKNGKEVVTYEVRYENGKEVSRKEVGRQVTIKPVNKIILVGTKEEVKPEPVEPVEPTEPEVVVEIKKELENNVLSYETVNQDDPTLEKGQTKVKQAGKNGKEVVTYEVRYENGKEVSRKEIGRQVTVKPVNEIILVGTKVTEVKEETKENTIAYETVKPDDPTLEKGQTKVKQSGKNGKEVITYEVTYENGKEVSRKEVKREVTVKPINEIVLVGTKEVEVKEETKENTIAYKTVKENDPTLEKGQTKVKQSGKNGKEVITYEVRYENGKEVSRKEVKREVTVKPINKIVLVGTKEVVSEKDLEQEFLNLVNAERKARGLSEFKIDSKLNEVAKLKAKDISDNGYWDHYSPTYGHPSDMAREFGVEFKGLNEVLTKKTGVPKVAFNALMNSVNHKNIMMSDRYTHAGVGYSTKDNVWTMMVINKW